MKIIPKKQENEKKTEIKFCFLLLPFFSSPSCVIYHPPLCFSPQKGKEKKWRIPPPFLFSGSHVPLPPHYVIRLTYPSFPRLVHFKKKSGKDSECATLYGKKGHLEKKDTFLLIHPSFVPPSLSLCLA